MNAASAEVMDRPRGQGHPRVSQSATASLSAWASVSVTDSGASAQISRHWAIAAVPSFASAYAVSRCARVVNASGARISAPLSGSKASRGSSALASVHAPLRTRKNSRLLAQAPAPWAASRQAREAGQGLRHARWRPGVCST